MVTSQLELQFNNTNRKLEGGQNLNTPLKRIFILLNPFCPGGCWSRYSLGGQFDPHFLTAPRGVLGHNSFNISHYTV